MAGYSPRSLSGKLGLKTGTRALFRRAPDGYAEALGPLPEGVKVMAALRGPLDFMHAFFDDAATYRRELPALRDALAPDGTLWVSWRKGGKKAVPATDLTENVVRDFALESGLVDVKVAAVDERWSGLKLVFRLSDRPARRAVAKR